jgi:tetrahydromethanopterin S-methyltransferase subunit G
MTVSMTAGEVAQAVQLAAGIGAFLGVVILGLIIFMMVRPSKRSREARLERQPDPDALDLDEVMSVLDRMEQRLGTLERVVIDSEEERPRIGGRGEQELLETGDESPAKRRTK